MSKEIKETTTTADQSSRGKRGDTVDTERKPNPKFEKLSGDRSKVGTRYDNATSSNNRDRFETSLGESHLSDEERNNLRKTYESSLGECRRLYKEMTRLGQVAEHDSTTKNSPRRLVEASIKEAENAIHELKKSLDKFGTFLKSVEEDIKAFRAFKTIGASQDSPSRKKEEAEAIKAFNAFVASQDSPSRKKEEAEAFRAFRSFEASRDRLSKMKTMHGFTQGKVSLYFMTAGRQLEVQSKEAEITKTNSECSRSMQKLEEFSRKYKKLEEAMAQEKSSGERDQLKREMMDILSMMEETTQQAIPHFEKENKLRYEQCINKCNTDSIEELMQNPRRSKRLLDNSEPSHPNEEPIADLVNKAAACCGKYEEASEVVKTMSGDTRMYGNMMLRDMVSKIESLIRRIDRKRIWKMLKDKAKQTTEEWQREWDIKRILDSTVQSLGDELVSSPQGLNAFIRERTTILQDEYESLGDSYVPWVSWESLKHAGLPGELILHFRNNYDGNIPKASELGRECREFIRLCSIYGPKNDACRNIESIISKEKTAPTNDSNCFNPQEMEDLNIPQSYRRNDVPKNSHLGIVYLNYHREYMTIEGTADSLGTNVVIEEYISKFDEDQRTKQ